MAESTKGDGAESGNMVPQQREEFPGISIDVNLRNSFHEINRVLVLVFVDLSLAVVIPSPTSGICSFYCR